MIENDSLKKIKSASIEETRSHQREIREYSNEWSQDDIEQQNRSGRGDNREELNEQHRHNLSRWKRRIERTDHLEGEENKSERRRRSPDESWKWSSVENRNDLVDNETKPRNSDPRKSEKNNRDDLDTDERESKEETDKQDRRSRVETICVGSRRDQFKTERIGSDCLR